MTTKPYLLHLTRSRLRERLFIHFFTHPESSRYLRELAILLRCDPANLSRDLAGLVREGIFQAAKRGNQKYFSLNRHYPLYHELKSVIHKKTSGVVPAPAHEIPVTSNLKKKLRAKVYVVAGPNGAGKTTFAKKFLPEFAGCQEFVNADLIAAGLSPFAPEGNALKAGRLLLEQIHMLQAKGSDFGFETTLAGKSYAHLFRELKEQGYELHLFFLWIPNIEMALARIRDRVKRGGHSIPEPVVRRRFYRGIKHFFNLYSPLVDSCALFENTDVLPHLVAIEEKGELKILDESLFKKIRKDHQ